MSHHREDHSPGAVVHAMNRGAAGQALFLDAQDYMFFMRTLSLAKQKFGFLVLAYCLMPNHFHLMLQVGPAAVQTFMHWIETRYAMYFNSKYERWGCVFHRRFRSIECRTEAYFWNLVRYIHQNPVKAGLVLAEAEWAWSSHRDLVAGDDSFIAATAVLARFGDDPSFARRNYLDFLGRESASATYEVCRGIFDSTEEMLQLEPWTAELHRRTLEELKETHQGASAPESRKRFINAARALGFSMPELAEFLELSRAGIYKAIR